VHRFLCWSKIEGDYKGFENLAYEFVKDRYPHPSWEKTQDSWDGNKDAYTVIFGFQPYQLNKEEWWMEAKFSKKSKTHRYRLDATIVSAIIAGNISKVIFVTNTIVSAKTILDIRRALKNSINCKTVDFCTKYTLEHWLLQNPTIFSKFFPDISINNIVLPNAFILEEIEFYSDASNKLAFREPLQSLEKGGRYYGYCSIFCNQEMTLKLKPASNLRGVSIKSGENIILSTGENTVKIVFDLATDFGLKKQDKITEKSATTLIFLLGDIELTPKKLISVVDREFPIYEIKSQQDIVKQIKSDLASFITRGRATVSFMIGYSGVGKSFIIRDVINSKALEDEDIFLVNMSLSDIDNKESILRLVLFILFPYLDATTIDLEYIKDMKENSYIGEFILEAIRHRDNPEELHRLITKNSNELTFLAGDLQIRRRIIIIDDFHNANIASNIAMLRLIEEIYLKRLPVFILVSSQVQFDRAFYDELFKTIVLREYKLELTRGDLESCIKNRINNNIDMTTLNMVFQNALEIFLFIRFLDDIGSEINTISDLKTACITFSESRILEEYILQLFNDTFIQNPQTYSVCSSIYWEPSRVNFSISPELEILYERSLIRQNPNGEVVSYHDIYTRCFKKHYPKLIDSNSRNPLEQLQNIIYRETAQSAKFRNSVEMILKFEDERKFYSVYYILDDIFTNENHQKLQNMYGKQNYYKLFMAYALASTNLSMRISGKSLFSRIYNETKHDPNQEIQIISSKALWELTNSCYEWLEFDTATEYANSLISLLKRIYKYSGNRIDIRNNVNYHNAHIIKVLISSDLRTPNTNTIYDICCNEIEDSGFDYRYHSFRLRYARTLMSHDGFYACSVIEECRDIFLEKWGKDDKCYLRAGMDAAYMRVVLYDTPIETMIHFQEGLKHNYYSDYRKSLLAVAAYFYSNGDIPSGNFYLLKDTHVFRKLRPRQQGFYYETLALHDIVQGNIASALENLSEAHEIFKDIPTYADIVIHNMDLLHSNRFNKDNIRYCIDKNMQPDIYYIDPRCVW